MNLFEELKRRNVFRMGIAYAVVAWVLLQAIDFTLDLISAPNWVMQVFFMAAVAGLPIVLIVSWVFEMTPDGIKRESEIDRGSSVTRQTGRKLDRTIIAFLAIAVILLLSERFLTGRQPSAPSPALTVAETGITKKPGEGAIRSVAVLPFVNMSSDPEQDYFSDGLSEELLNRLAKNDRLHVAARTSSFQFKGQNLDISEIGQQLKVGHILEGSVRKAANRLRITAQLIQVDSGYHLWSETYEREIDDIFAIQDDISTAITRALEAELGTQVAGSKQKPTDNIEAYQLYLQARYLLAQRGGDNMLAAAGLFEQATSLDNQFSEAWSGMAFTYSLLPAYTFQISTYEASDRATESARKAIAIDPENAEAFMALGSVQSNNLETLAGRENLERAYQLAPNNVDVVNMYGDFLRFSGDFDRSMQMERKAIELDPLAAVHYSDLAFLLLNLGRNEEALEQALIATRLAPDSPDRHESLIISLIILDRYQQAIETIQMVEDKLDVAPGIASHWRALLYYQQGDRENLRLILNQRLDVAENSRDSSAYTDTAFYTLWLDGVEAALPLLQKAYDKREFLLVDTQYFYLPEHVSNDPLWTAFWQQPGLAELIATRREFGPFDHIGYWRDPGTP